MHARLIVGDLEGETCNYEFEIRTISQARDLKSFLKTKFPGPTEILLTGVDESTEEAQNALLKIIEEPPENIAFVLSCRTADTLLPTIVSRCEVVNKARNSKFEIRKEAISTAKKFTAGRVGEKLKIVSKIKKRDEALDFTNAVIAVGHKELLANPGKKIAKLLGKSSITLSNLKANGNVGIHLTNLVIS